MFLSISSYLRFLVFSFLVFSSYVFAGFDYDCYDCTAVNTHSYGTCSDLVSCVAVFGTRTSGGNIMYPTGDFLVVAGGIVMQYGSNYGGTHSRKVVLVANTEDCFIAAGTLACGLTCTTSQSCAVHALNSCGGAMESFSYGGAGNYEATCATIVYGDTSGGGGDVNTGDTITVVTAQGSRGVAGSNGLDGSDGADGVAGLAGADGIAGVDGADGVDGIAGADGVAGTDGSDGADGIAGTDGTNGTNGTNGRNGIDGVHGRNGIDGIVDPEITDNLADGILQNKNGITHLNNVIDETVTPNIQANKEGLATNLHSINTLFAKDLDLGTAQEQIAADTIQNTTDIALINNHLPSDGADGADGTNGINGTNGTDGVDGIAGLNGTDGTDGTKGADGIDGVAGLNGADGINGINGAQGADGENVDTDAVIAAIDSSSDFLKSQHSISPNTTVSDAYGNLFDNDAQDALLVDIERLKLDINLENKTFFEFVKSKFNFSVSSSGYESRLLDLSGWGTFDVSLSRFAVYFGGLGNMVYFFATLMSLTIVLSGVRL